MHAVEVIKRDGHTIPRCYTCGRDLTSKGCQSALYADFIVEEHRKETSTSEGAA